MRAAAALLHRGMGLAIAGFLFVSGLTGAVISWDHELDELLNPALTTVTSDGPPRDALELAHEVEQRDPRAQVVSIPLAAEPGESLVMFVQPRVDPSTGRLYEPGYNQVFLDPLTGAELGWRTWGAGWPVTRETFVSFLYKLHYSCTALRAHSWPARTHSRLAHGTGGGGAFSYRRCDLVSQAPGTHRRPKALFAIANGSQLM